MIVHKCDRCGKFVDNGNTMPKIRGWISETARMTDLPLIDMELCSECFKAIEEFLLHKGEKNGNN